jgi:hypothetical protein
MKVFCLKNSFGAAWPREAQRPLGSLSSIVSRLGDDTAGSTSLGALKCIVPETGDDTGQGKLSLLISKLIG